jgi:hypothetical protein
MPLEIKELTIRVHVTQNTQENKTTARATSISSSLRKEIVQDCYEKVMRVIERQKHR